MTQDRAPSNARPAASGPSSILGRHGFLISELSTLGIACFVAERLWYRTQFPPGAWAAVMLLWLLLAVGAAAWARTGARGADSAKALGAARLLAVCLCSIAVKASAAPFSWRQAGAFGLILLAAQVAGRLFLGLLARSRATGSLEGLRFGAAQGVALFAVHPYLRSGILGAGDASSYSLMVADFLEQWRAGIFPIFIGQSRYAFSGGFHSIRNAPLLEHLAWLFDLLSLGTLNVFALLNLTVLASVLGGVLGCYVALRISLLRSPWLALALAVLYGLCPGVLAPLYAGDMYPTFLTLPFIPWLILGIEQSSVFPRRTWPWALQATALAALWLAHPPVAAWATLVAVVVGAWTVIRDRSRRVLLGIVLALALFLSLSGYLFVSVRSLRLPAVPRAVALSSVDYKVSILRDNWVASFLPVSHGGTHLLSDLQLGYGLWACLLLSAAGAARVRSGRCLLGCLSLILLFAWPIPVLTRFAWRSLPSELLVITNQWPVERFYVLLAAIAVFTIAGAFSRYFARGPWQRPALSALLLAACLWSAAETVKFFRRAEAIAHSEGASEAMHLPENITLSRTHSYEYLGVPDYFSNGHMDPRLETRLLDLKTGRVFADGSSYKAGLSDGISAGRTLTLRKPADGFFAETLRLNPGDARILRFDFLGQQPEGELQITGSSLNETYTLPQSGKSRSFGSAPMASHTLILENSTDAPETASFRFLGRDGGDAFARVSVEPLAENERAIRLASLTPFHAFITADRDCYLETPKLFVPGYRAYVDNVPTVFWRSTNGLIIIPLGKGEHEVTLAYVGSRVLRWSYFGAAAAWLAVLSMIGVYASEGARDIEHWVVALGRSLAVSRRRAIRRLFSAPAALVLFVLAVAAALGLEFGRSLPAATGELHMVIKLPRPDFGRSEPLVTTGRPGAGDFIYVTYLDGAHVLVGHDKWNFGGLKSGPIAVDYEGIQNVEIGLGSLYPEPSGSKEANSTEPELRDLRNRVFVKWNGVLVLSEVAAAYPTSPSEVTVGANTIGGSTTLSHFSGDILSLSRGAPEMPK